MPIRLYPNNLIHTMQPASVMDKDWSATSASSTLFYNSPEKHQFDYLPAQQSIQSPLSTWNMTSTTEFSLVNKPKRPTLTSNPSRKRSRDHIDDEYVELSSPAETNGFAMELIEEPIYGPGMTLLNPSTGRVISAESQTGTWIEEKAEEDRIAEEKRVEAARPILRPSKSSRLDITTTSQVESPVASTPVEIDPASIMLGVGWKVMASEDEDMNKAVRGWARYIENHYPLNGVQIVSKSESKEAFLVQSDEGYWLFKEDLDEGQLISTTWPGCVAGLTSMPMVFEGMAPITAQRSPSPSREEFNHAIAPDAPTGMDLD